MPGFFWSKGAVVDKNVVDVINHESHEIAIHLFLLRICTKLELLLLQTLDFYDFNSIVAFFVWFCFVCVLAVSGVLMVLCYFHIFTYC